MKKLFKSAIILLLTLCLCSCAEAPENVKEQESILDNAGRSASSEESEENPSSSTLDVEIQQKQRGTLDDIRAQLATDLSQNITRVKVENAYVSDAELMPTYDTHIGTAEMDNLYGLAEYVFGDEYDTSDKSLYMYCDSDDPIYPEYPATDYPCDWNNDGRIESANSYLVDLLWFQPLKDDYTLTVGAQSIGTIGINEVSQIENLDESNPALLTVVAEYNVLKDDISGVSYPMKSGEEWKLEDAIEYTENFYNEQLVCFDDSNVCFKVNYVSVHRLDNGNYGYLLIVGCYDENGNYIDTSFDGEYKRDWSAVGAGESFCNKYRSYTWYFEKETFGHLNKDYSLTDRVATDSGNDLLTLSAAINIIDKTLAEEIPLDIPCAELCYVVYCKKYDFYDKWGSIKPKSIMSKAIIAISIVCYNVILSFARHGFSKQRAFVIPIRNPTVASLLTQRPEISISQCNTMEKTT